jgi:hypothetical protein
MTAPRTRWYLRPFPLALLTLLALTGALVVTIRDYASRRLATFAWIEKTQSVVTFGAAPAWIPAQWFDSWPRWALPVESVELTAQASDELHRLLSLREARTLNLREVLVTDAQLQQLSGFSRLRSLAIYSAQVTDAGVVPLFRYKTLHDLDLTGTSISDAGVKQLAGQPLESLKLSSTQVTDDCMETVSSFRQLHTLLLEGTAVGDTGLARLAGLPLRQLGLAGTKVSDAGMVALGPMPELIWLHLDRTDVGDETLAIVGTWTDLSTLTLSHTRITDAGLALLTSPSLRTLDLSWTAVSDAGLDELPPKPDLGYLELSGTRVSADIARGFAKSHALVLTFDAGRRDISMSGPRSKGTSRLGGMGMF